MIKKMKKVLIYLIAFAIMFYLSFPKNMEPKSNIRLDESGYFVSKYARISQKEWATINTEHSGYDTAEELLIALDESIETIIETLNRENWGSELKSQYGENFDTTIEIRFTYEVSNAIGGGSGINPNIHPLVKLNRSRFESNNAPCVHELTHIISPETESLSLSEGLACYMQDEKGNSFSFPNYGVSVHKMAKEYLSEENKYIIAYIGNTQPEAYEIYYSKNMENMERAKFYCFSSSFTRYLIKTYGINNFMELYSAKLLPLEYQNVYGEDLESLLLEWQLFLNQYDESNVRD